MKSDMKAEQAEYRRFLEALGRRIRLHRKRRGWTQAQVNWNGRFYESHWRRIEQGKTMSLQTLLRISRMFDVSVSELVAGLDEGRARQVTSKLR
jgi:transcriptional regulator with XRE-family HTH domain